MIRKILKSKISGSAVDIEQCIVHQFGINEIRQCVTLRIRAIQICNGFLIFLYAK